MNSKFLNRIDKKVKKKSLVGWTKKPQPLKTDRPSLIKESWFYGGVAPSFHLVLTDHLGQINIHMPKKFTLRLNKK